MVRHYRTLYRFKAVSKTYDDTVSVGLVSANRGFVGEIFGICFRAAVVRGDRLLYAGISLAQYEKAVRLGAEGCALGHFHFVPHQARHGGPSEDMASKALSAEDIQARGRWAVATSVKRYKKDGVLLREQSKVSLASVEEARRVPQKIIRVFQRVL